MSLPHLNHRQTKGSILIWSVMLGFILTSVFFFFGMRQRLNTEVQRDTNEILNARAYMESYADYLKAQGKKEIKNVTFDGIKTNLTQKLSTINGFLDFKKSVTYSTDASINIFISWNKCDKNQIGFFKLNNKNYLNSGGGCAQSNEYDDRLGPVQVNGDFTLENVGGPFDYEIISSDGSLITDKGKWHMNLSMTLSNNKEIKLQSTFED